VRHWDESTTVGGPCAADNPTSLVNIHYGSPTVSQRKRISHESRGAEFEALTHKSLAPREHILGLDALFDEFHQQIKEDLARQYGAHMIDTTGSTFTISYEQLYPVVVSPRAYVTVTLVTPDVT
jgi:hypothetical protein